MHPLKLTEYEPHSIRFPLNKGQLTALGYAHIGVTPSPSEGETYVLRPSHHIGAVRAGDLSIVVPPKIPMDRVMFLVAYALDPKDWRQYSFSLRPDRDVLEGIIPAFTHHTHQAIRRGLLQGYRREEDSLHTVRGRIRFDEQINRRFGAPLPIEVAYDEFTEDVEENRLLKTALHRLTRLPVRSREARRSVLAMRPVFSPVGLGMYRRGSPEVYYTRLNYHYRPAVELARLIIDNSSLELFHGEVAGASFLLDMNKVFERFLYVALREALGLPESQWQTQASLTLDKADAIKMKPDLSWWKGGRYLFVGDAKYKKLELSPDLRNAEKYRHADIYQMLAYCTAADVPSGLLVYAAGEGEPGKYRIRNADKTIEVASVNLRGTPENILGEVGRIARRVKAHSWLAASRYAT